MGLKRVRGTRSHGSLYYGSTTDSISVPCLSVSERDQAVAKKSKREVGAIRIEPRS
jgi:hypothetical protein